LFFKEKCYNIHINKGIKDMLNNQIKNAKPNKRKDFWDKKADLKKLLELYNKNKVIY
jgi:hypothetical protein